MLISARAHLWSKSKWMVQINFSSKMPVAYERNEIMHVVSLKVRGGVNRNVRGAS